VAGLRTVPSLKRNRSAARETEPVKPVSDALVEATLPHLPRPVAALVWLQRLTGRRPSELLTMRAGELERDGDVWWYRPASHKNDWRGQEAVIALGPKAQAIIAEFLKEDPEVYLFSPKDVVAELRATRKGGRPVGMTAACYDRRTYRQAVIRACRKTGLPGWTPYQLRHTVASEVDARYGVLASSTVLGHATPKTTALYVERDRTALKQIVREIG
jgi:integrase